MLWVLAFLILFEKYILHLIKEFVIMIEEKFPYLNPKIEREIAKTASSFYDRIQEQIHNFENELMENEILEVRVITFDRNNILVKSFGYHNPNMIIVHGFNINNNEVKLLIHQNNIQIVLTKIIKTDQIYTPIEFQAQA